MCSIPIKSGKGDFVLPVKSSGGAVLTAPEIKEMTFNGTWLLRATALFAG